MKIISAIILWVLMPATHKNANSTEVLQSMYSRYHGNWHKSLSFNQTTERYRNDSLIKTSTWYETIVYPDLLRIDFDSPNSSAGVIFRHDSTYAFRNKKIVRSTGDENELIFFLGGMYSMTFEKVLGHFLELNYDLSKFHASTWKGKPVYVLGANKDGDEANQLWIDQEGLFAVRFIKYAAGTKEEGFFEQQIPLKNAWSETKCSFYINDKLLQVETYHNLIPDAPADMRMFDPGSLNR